MPLASEGLTSAALLYVIREASHVLRGCKARIIIYICIDCQLSNCLSSLQTHSKAQLGSFLLSSLAALLCIFAICLHWAKQTVSLLQISARSFLDLSSRLLAHSYSSPGQRFAPCVLSLHLLNRDHHIISELFSLPSHPGSTRLPCEWDVHKKYNIRITILLHCWAFRDLETSKWHLC